MADDPADMPPPAGEAVPRPVLSVLSCPVHQSPLAAIGSRGGLGAALLCTFFSSFAPLFSSSSCIISLLSAAAWVGSYPCLERGRAEGERERREVRETTGGDKAREERRHGWR